MVSESPMFPGRQKAGQKIIRFKDVFIYFLDEAARLVGISCFAVACHATKLGKSER